MTRVRGFMPWSPQKGTLLLLDQVHSVLAEYEEYLPLTIRQIFYNLVTRFEYEKTELAYARLCEMLNRARRSGRIQFEHIRDDGGSALRTSSWASPDHFRRACKTSAKRYQLDRQSGQPLRLWLLSEAGGMVPLLHRTVATYGVPVLSSGGFDSVTAKHNLAQELAKAECPCEILHIGDLDPSGIHLFRSLAEDVTAMVASLASYVPKFTRLAVTPEQVKEMDLPTAPPKKTDKRAFVGATTQAEAIRPDVLSALVVEAVRSRQCQSARQDVLDVENEHRLELVEWIEAEEGPQ